ncbi:MAG TPA: hypothetical protein DF480_04215 [Clostridiales bacterium]|nr:hypothetical protein [Clostridiales bacterium]
MFAELPEIIYKQQYYSRFPSVLLTEEFHFKLHITVIYTEKWEKATKSHFFPFLFYFIKV